MIYAKTDARCARIRSGQRVKCLYIPQLLCHIIPVFLLVSQRSDTDSLDDATRIKVSPFPAGYPFSAPATIVSWIRSRNAQYTNSTGSITITNPANNAPQSL